MYDAREPPEDVPTDFGGRLTMAMRLRDNYKATALACALGVNESAVSRWKRGGPITLAHAIGLCDALDISMDWLIRGIGSPDPQPVPHHPLAPPRVSPQTVAELRALLHAIAPDSPR